MVSSVFSGWFIVTLLVGSTWSYEVYGVELARHLQKISREGLGHEHIQVMLFLKPNSHQTIFPTDFLRQPTIENRNPFM